MEIKKEIIEKILEVFIEELKLEGGIDIEKSLWQKPGRGVGLLPDYRYINTLVNVLYRYGEKYNKSDIFPLTDAQVYFISEIVQQGWPKDVTWMLGTALECIGFYFRHHGFIDERLKKNVYKIIEIARKRKVEIKINNLTYSHFPCGYGLGDYCKDAGWTNDLGIFGSGLVYAYEVTKDESILNDAISFSEYFCQPYNDKKISLGKDGYWHCGTWRGDIGCWVIGPDDYKGFESVDVAGNETSWIFSTYPCVDYLTHLYEYKKDERYMDLPLKAVEWTFRECQFEDGGVGICGRDDKWLGATGCAVFQTLKVKRIIGEKFPEILLEKAKKSYKYLCEKLEDVKIENYGVCWVNHKTSIDPLVNVGWLFLLALRGYIEGEELYQ